MTHLRTLLALASILFTFTACVAPPDETTPVDDDEVIADDDDTTPTVETGIAMLDATLPDVGLILTPVNGGEARDVVSCTTLCELDEDNEIPVGDYRVTGTVANGVVIPKVITITEDEVCEDTLEALLTPSGVYDAHRDTCDGEILPWGNDLNVYTKVGGIVWDDQHPGPQPGDEVWVFIWVVGELQVTAGNQISVPNVEGGGTIALDLETISFTSDDGSELCLVRQP